MGVDHARPQPQSLPSQGNRCSRLSLLPRLHDLTRLRYYQLLLLCCPPLQRRPLQLLPAFPPP